MNEHYISSINIKRVRHHINKVIPISNKEKKHLIITGRNGSGKTSLLESIMQYLFLFEKYPLSNLRVWKDALKREEERSEFIQKQLENPDLSNSELENLRNQLNEVKYHIQNFSNSINEHTSQLDLDINLGNDIFELFKEGEFLIAYFPASRLSNMATPNGVEKISLPEKNFGINQGIGSIFVKYLVDLKTQEMFASREGDTDFAEDISRWFFYLESNLKMIFENEDLELKFDYKNYNFLLKEPGKEPYTLNELSSGFSSILNIVTELIMRMEGKNRKTYDIEGFVLIDEIEAHLHVSLQKKILKFLSDFFPSIQFIVTTHSPFVINSIENVTIYDLEKSIVKDDLSNYSYRAIVEQYLGVDQYSYIVKEKVKEYESLINKYKTLNEKEKLRYQELDEDLSNVPDLYSEELKLQKAFADLKIIMNGDNQ
ncbi:AAA family ATPase [Cytobacillus firmus]|nr:AAA family ATPase [Cytobacillus firmus]